MKGEFVSNTTAREFEGALDALRTMKTEAERSYSEHVWDSNMTNWYYDVFKHTLQDSQNNSIPTQYKNQYKGNVSFNTSVISIPMDVYSNWTEVRNTIQWTEKMEDTFKNNYKTRSEYLIWQYIGTPQGVMRTYPGMSLYPFKTRENFDVRKRPWYNAGIGCPKDVVILVDISGSMDGLPLFLMKATFKRLVEQILSDVDYITAIKVGETASFLTCHGELRRATKQVKGLMYNAIDMIQVGGVSNWVAGLTLAFQTLEAASNTTANCEKAVIVMSDETGQPINDMVNKLNSEKRVRVYSLSFRRNEGYVHDKLRQTACNNRGNYLKVMNYADIDGALQNIVQIGNRPLKGQKVAPTWSNAYRDLGEVGMVVTATLPLVVDSSPSQINATGDRSKVTFLGIVGLDFKASRIVRISMSVLPLQCSMLIINNKGYPIYHPRIRQYSYERVNTRLNKFQYTKENNQEFLKLERIMIDKGHNITTFRSFMNTGDVEDHGSDWYQELVYHVFPLDKTPLSIAVIWGSYPQKYYMYSPKVVDTGVVNRTLCSWNASVHYDLKENPCNILDWLSLKKGERFEWNWKNSTDICSTFIFSVFTDIFLSQNLTDNFFFSPIVNITNHFMITYTGLAFFSNPSWSAGPNISHVYSEFYPFKKSARNLEGASLIMSPPHQKLDSRVVLLIKPLVLKETHEDYSGDKNPNKSTNVSVQIGAVGIEVELESLRDYVFSGPFSGPFSDPDQPDHKFQKFLIDENGLIVLSYPGQFDGFLSNIHSSLFRVLYRKQIYTLVDFTECIHRCKVFIPHVEHSSSEISGASPLLPSFPPTCSLLQSLFHLLLRLLLHSTSLLYTSILHSTSLMHTSLFFSLPPGASADHKVITKDCCKDFKQYQRNFSFVSKLTVESWCQCTSIVTIAPVDGTNLMLITDHRPDCNCTTANRMDPRDGVPSADDSEELVCINNDTLSPGLGSYYVSFQTCILGDKYDPSVCSEAYFITISTWLLFFAFYIYVSF